MANSTYRVGVFLDLAAGRYRKGAKAAAADTVRLGATMRKAAGSGSLMGRRVAEGARGARREIDRTAERSGRLGRALRLAGRDGERGIRRLTGITGKLRAQIGLATRAAGKFRGIGGVAALGGGTFAVSAALKRVITMEERIERLGIQSKRSLPDMQRLRKEIYATANLPEIRLNPSQLLAAVEAIVEKTGDLDFARDNLSLIAQSIQGTGGRGDDLGRLAAEFRKLRITDPAEVARSFNLLTAQGKEGAFTLGDFAGQGPRLFSAFSRFKYEGPDAVRQLGAISQAAMMNTGSAERASTAVEALLRTLSDAEKIDAIWAEFGVNVQDPSGAFRPMYDILKDINAETGGDVVRLSKVFDAETARALPTGKVWEEYERILALQAPPDMLAQDAARIAKTTGAQIQEKKTSVDDWMQEHLTGPLGAVATALGSLESEILAVVGIFAGYRVLRAGGSLVKRLAGKGPPPKPPPTSPAAAASAAAAAKQATVGQRISARFAHAAGLRTRTAGIAASEAAARAAAGKAEAGRFGRAAGLRARTAGIAASEAAARAAQTVAGKAEAGRFAQAAGLRTRTAGIAASEATARAAQTVAGKAEAGRFAQAAGLRARTAGIAASEAAARAAAGKAEAGRFGRAAGLRARTAGIAASEATARAAQTVAGKAEAGRFAQAAGLRARTAGIAASEATARAAQTVAGKAEAGRFAQAAGLRARTAGIAASEAAARAAAGKAEAGRFGRAAGLRARTAGIAASEATARAAQTVAGKAEAGRFAQAAGLRTRTAGIAASEATARAAQTVAGKAEAGRFAQAAGLRARTAGIGRFALRAAGPASAAAAIGLTAHDAATGAIPKREVAPAAGGVAGGLAGSSLGARLAGAARFLPGWTKLPALVASSLAGWFGGERAGRFALAGPGDRLQARASVLYGSALLGGSLAGIRRGEIPGGRRAAGAEPAGIWPWEPPDVPGRSPTPLLDRAAGVSHTERRRRQRDERRKAALDKPVEVVELPLPPEFEEPPESHIQRRRRGRRGAASGDAGAVHTTVNVGPITVVSASDDPQEVAREVADEIERRERDRAGGLQDTVVANQTDEIVF